MIKQEIVQIQLNSNMSGEDRKKGYLGESMGNGIEGKIITEDHVNTTANNSLRFSNLASHSYQSTTTGINCPIYQHEGIYKCEICSNLRVVCPRNRNNNTESKETNNVNIEHRSNINRQSITNMSQNLKAVNLKRSEGIKGGDGFVHNLNIDKKLMDFSKSIPLRTNQPFVTRPVSSGGFSMHMHGVGTRIGNDGTSTKPPTPATPAFIPGPNGHMEMYSRSGIRYIQQVVYVPVIHNIIKPQFINPETKFQHSTNFKHEKTPQQNRTKLSEPLTSPIRVENYDDRVMTPTNLRNLANSIIR